MDAHSGMHGKPGFCRVDTNGLLQFELLDTVFLFLKKKPLSESHVAFMLHEMEHEIFWLTKYQLC